MREGAWKVVAVYLVCFEMKVVDEEKCVSTD